ncbi:hypothetical protein [Flavobacterium soli]|uniref:hypothetical protein n=1 Tax=Flavobacterium soli TaxID=344881 RepID=UPI0004000396|nr:hypothetical protein [Flavobacterium soli]
MCKKIQIVALALFALQFANGQIKKTEDFNIVKPDYTTQSNFSHLQIIDSRKDTANYGIVQKGAFNKRALVQPKIPIAVQLDSIFHLLKANADATPQDTLVLQLRDMKFAEITESFKETGYFYLRANAYHKKGQTYSEVNSTDLIETVNAMDVTQKNYKNASRIINDFMGKAMSSKASPDRTFTVEQIVNMDKIEKQAIPLYAAEKLTDGIYVGYFGFKDQIPNYTDFKVERNKKGDVRGVKFLDHNGKYSSIGSDRMYAFVENGVPYIATEYGFYKLIKREDDYFYTGRVRVAGDGAAIVAASIMFGIIGGIVTSHNLETVEIMIDHITGATVTQTSMK